MNSRTSRAPAVAGLFYPGDPRELDQAVHRYLDDAYSESAASADAPPKAIIAPHAGYIYSGAVAAAAYARLKPLAQKVRRVVLLGPSHRVPIRGLAASDDAVFATPLGPVSVDTDAVNAILTLPQVTVLEAAHREEHSLEVHLPFLQAVLGDFKLVPLVVGQTTAEAVADVLERLWGGDETLIVISSDLSHYLDYDSARAIDAETCRAIETLNPSAIGPEQACGRVPVGGLLTVARRRGLTVRTLDLRNSGDTAGDRRRVVGYGSWMFTEPVAKPGQSANENENEDKWGEDSASVIRTRELLERHGETLLRLAASSIENGLLRGRPLDIDDGAFARELSDHGACFVTLKKSGSLRGCIGSPKAHRPLIKDLANNAFAAAFEDNRFPKLTAEERRELALSISLLSPPEPLSFTSEADLLDALRPGIDGLIIDSDGHRALFLPQVWESLPEPRRFLGQLKSKAGLTPNYWSDDFRAWRFSAVSVSSDSLTDPTTLWT